MGWSLDTIVSGLALNLLHQLPARAASLPSTSHLQILLSLLESQPTLKSSILALIPSLDVQFCLDDLQAKTKVVSDAVPLGAGRGGVMVRSGSGIFGGGRSTFDQCSRRGSMSEGYVLNRLRAPINDFCATVGVVFLFFFLFVMSLTLDPSDRPWYTSRSSLHPPTIHHTQHPSTNSFHLSLI